MRVLTTRIAAAKQTPSGIRSEWNPRERILFCGKFAAAKRTPSGIRSERNPRERILFCGQ
jgi:hypothetical protein